MPFIRVFVKYEAAEPTRKNQQEMLEASGQGKKKSAKLGQQKTNPLLEEAFTVVRERIGDNMDWAEFKVQKVMQ